MNYPCWQCGTSPTVAAQGPGYICARCKELSERSDGNQGAEAKRAVTPSASAAQENSTSNHHVLAPQAQTPTVEEANKEPICRCGHAQNDHGSRTEQRPGEKVYIQPCEHCPCEVFTHKGGPLDQLVESFRRLHPSPIVRSTPAPSETPTVEQFITALKHIVSRTDTERILERLGLSEQEIADAIR